MLTKIIKRDGREVPFNIEKIANAIFKAAQAVGGSDYDQAMALACEVSEIVESEAAVSGALPGAFRPPRRCPPGAKRAA